MTTLIKYLFAGALAMALTMNPPTASTSTQKAAVHETVDDWAPAASRGTVSVILGRKIMDRY